MDTIVLILHGLAAAVLVGGMVLMFFAVTPATWIMEDEALRRIITRVVARRFAVLSMISLGVLLVTGLLQFASDGILPPHVRDNMMSYRFGLVFTAKMITTIVLVVMIVGHGMWLAPRIARATETVIESPGDEDARIALENIRRQSFAFSFVMLLAAAAVFAMGVTLGSHEYAHVLN
ncbi:MAG TPA: hypothetical protein QF624_07950 [Dehalococcoidia bacterium]|nr:hypothetical protein [Dehalococcoidia bacterium]